ncbi:MAG: hypothetical protein NWR67_00350 [Saprospiraceae bacterium]|nr:hypothetical protein [Saprospiraceae bacterium]
MRIDKLSAALLPFVFCCNFLSAQNLATEQVDVIKNFDARLADSERFRLNPKLPPLDSSSKRMDYLIQSRVPSIAYPAPRIKPLAYATDQQAKQYAGFLQAGAGYPLSLYLDGGYQLSTTDKSDVGIAIRHHAANNDSRLANQRFQYSQGSLNGKLFLDQGIAVKGGATYTRDEVHFYGYHDQNQDRDSSNLLAFDREAVRQRFSVLDLHAGVSNGEQTIGDLNYDVNLDGYFMRDNYASSENNFTLDVRAKKWIQKKNPLELQLVADLTRFRDTTTQKLNNFYFSPSYTLHTDALRVKLGARVASSADQFFFFPAVEASLGLVGNVVHLFAGAEGNLVQNNFRSLSDYNPFLVSNPELRNTSYYHFYAGAKGAFSGLDYHAQLGYKATTDLALFQPNHDTIPRFLALYDNVNIIQLSVGLSGQIFDNLSLHGTLNQQVYRPENQEKAWLLPTFSLQVGAVYRMLDDKLSLRANLFAENGLPYLDAEGQAQRLNALFDISAGAEYQFAENIGLFLNVNNLANNRRQRWTGYPVFGVNALGGIRARF